MIVPKLPLFIVDGNDLSVHSTLENAASWLEPIDLYEDDSNGYDAEGRLLHFEAAGLKVKISLAEEVPHHALELEEALRNYLTAVGNPLGENSACDLNCLVEACKEFVVPEPMRPWVAIKKFLSSLLLKGRK